MTRPHLSGAGAFSLVEVALSLAILAVGMVGVLALLPVGLDSARQVHAETVASQVVRGAIAKLAVSNPPAVNPEYFGREGETNASSADGYFRLDYNQSGGTGSARRYFLTLTWPAGAATNSPMAQTRTFVTDVLP
jgi:type II secretory pathway pseudopilin PulG